MIEFCYVHRKSWKWVGCSYSTITILFLNGCLSGSVLSIQLANKACISLSNWSLVLFLSIALLNENQKSDVNVGKRREELWRLAAGILRELGSYHCCSAISFPCVFLVLRELTWLWMDTSSGWTSFTLHQLALG